MLVQLTTCFHHVPGFQTRRSSISFEPAAHDQHWSTTRTTTTTTSRERTSLSMAATKKKKKKKKSGGGGGGGGVGIKGFGSSTSDGSGTNSLGSSSSSSTVTIDRSKEALALYDYLERRGGGANLKRVALGHFPLPGTTTTIRGVVALKPIAKGDIIVSIPYEMAFNLGPGGSDPTGPAVELLERICVDDDNNDNNNDNNDAPYIRMLPPFQGDDCLGSTDFFSSQALDALQFPTVRTETLRRRRDVEARFDEQVSSAAAVSSSTTLSHYQDTPVTSLHLAWASWLVTSRVLTVRVDTDPAADAYRLMIPLIDMCNHDRSSPHVLSGRAATNGQLKIIAGRDVAAGDQVNICYGGGVAGNDRFVQDYGFLDEAGYEPVAQQLLRTTSPGPTWTRTERDEIMTSLRTTTIEEDEALLASSSNTAMAPDMKSAIQFRMGVKKALAKLQTS